ncbi:PGF-pre-PGF domain-containing protein [Methanosarcina sp.]|uniref:PGF-pre-PGF domain-containing protein n=1 Tax=Methanosarcina sp. TaxID=2213 RepID=UPI003C7120D1
MCESRRILAIIFAAFILIANIGIGVVAAEETGARPASDDSAGDSLDDSSSNDASTGATTSDDTVDESTDDSSASDTTDEENSDDETNIDYEETNIEEETNIVYEETTIEEDTTVIVDDADDVITSDGPVIYEETTTDITDIETTDTTIVGDGNDVDTITSGGPGTVIHTEEENTEITDIDNTEITDIDNTYSDDDTTIVENSTIYDNDSSDYTSSYNSTTVIQTIETTEIDMDNSKTVSIDVENDNSVVNNIYFVPTKDAGKAKVVVEDLKPESIKKPLTGVVYKSFNIFIDNDNKQVIDIDNAAVDFKVEKSWLIANGLDSSAIVLNMYEGGKWVEVPITITSEDSRYIYFKAEVDEYSTFAITSKEITVDKVLKQTVDTPQEEEIDDTPQEEEIDEPTKNVVIKLLEVIIEILEGN